MFGEKADPWAAALAGGVLIYLFYGLFAGAVAAVIILGTVYASPVTRLEPLLGRRILLGLAFTLIPSAIFRVFFVDGFCVDAPFSETHVVQGFESRFSMERWIVDQIGIEFRNMCKSDLFKSPVSTSGRIRDFGLPILGAICAFFAVRKPK